MMDLEEKGPESEGLNRAPLMTMKVQRSCSDCQTTITPLWRGGPAGPKSLCNACGIKYNKKRRALQGLDKDRKKKMKKKSSAESRQRLGREAELQRSQQTIQRRKLGEEERAAILLMALSCESLFGCLDQQTHY